jgi:hypothetical protein
MSGRDYKTVANPQRFEMFGRDFENVGKKSVICFPTLQFCPKLPH